MRHFNVNISPIVIFRTEKLRIQVNKITNQQGVHIIISIWKRFISVNDVEKRGRYF